MNKLRGIDDDFAEAFKKNKLYQFYKKHKDKDELFIGVRNNCLNIYYNCGSIVKIEYKNGKFFYDISDSYLDKKPEEITPQFICEKYEDIKEKIIKYRGVEGKAQSKLVYLNNNNELSKWFCVDIENANSGFRGRFDIIAITKKPPYKTALIELKYGARAFDGKGGIYEHIENFYRFKETGYFKDLMRKEIVYIIDSLKKININTPFDNIPEVNSILPEPDFYFITIDNNPEKEGACTPKQRMSARLFNDKRWNCKKLSKKLIVQNEFGDVTDINNKRIHVNFLFSTQNLYKGIIINDIIEDRRYDKEPKMKITIHRGTNQIGGCITEIESNGYKVFIDFGEQLPGTENDNNKLPEIRGLTSGDVSRSALLITHYHGDHIGKIYDTAPGLPIYAGETALKIFECLESKLINISDKTKAIKHKINIELAKSIKTFKPLQRIKIGEIIITPLFIDHSAFDAYMFVVEADSKRVLHTGDFRGHGFRGKVLIPVLKKYAQNIDYIISEGSNIERPNAVLQTEQELQKDFEIQFRKNKYNFIFVSSINIDRIFALYHAAKRAKRCFVCDDYQTNILKIVSNSHKKYTSKTLFDTVKPKCGIIPIHTEAPEKFKDLFPNHNIILLKDGYTI
jgi:ribonuclease BN (tRNA processing enzyme)